MPTYYHPDITFMKLYSTVVSLSFGGDPGLQPTRIDFSPGTDQSMIDTINSAAAEFDWVPLTPPDIPGLVAAIENDPSLTNILELIIPFYAAIENYTINPQVIKTAWVELKITYSSQLTPDIVSTIEGYAISNRMPLT